MTRNAAYSTLMTVHEMVLKIQARALGRDPLFMSPEELDALAKVRVELTNLTGLMEARKDWR